jgi:hypothetical protein
MVNPTQENRFGNTVPRFMVGISGTIHTSPPVENAIASDEMSAFSLFTTVVREFTLGMGLQMPIMSIIRVKFNLNFQN